jgi:hypothetical protein
MKDLLLDIHYALRVLWLAHIQRAQQHCIHYSKDEDVRPDPQH